MQSANVGVKMSQLESGSAPDFVDVRVRVDRIVWILRSTLDCRHYHQVIAVLVFIESSAANCTAHVAKSAHAVGSSLMPKLHAGRSSPMDAGQVTEVERLQTRASTAFCDVAAAAESVALRARARALGVYRRLYGASHVVGRRDAVRYRLPMATVERCRTSSDGWRFRISRGRRSNERFSAYQHRRIRKSFAASLPDRRHLVYAYSVTTGTA